MLHDWRLGLTAHVVLPRTLPASVFRDGLFWNKDLRTAEAAQGNDHVRLPLAETMFELLHGVFTLSGVLIAVVVIAAIVVVAVIWRYRKLD